MTFFTPTKTTLSIIAASSLFVTTNLVANSCSKADIDYYLQRGFTHDQVVRLCAIPGVSTATPSQVPARRVMPATVAPATNYTNNYSNPAPVPSQQFSAAREDQVYLEAALKATNIKLTPPVLSYDAKECIEYGDKNLAELNDKACVKSKITINLKGLRIVKASKGVFLLRDTEMVIEGDIQREYLNINSIRRQDREAIQRLLPNKPRQLNLPIRNGIDPKQISEKLQRHIS